MRLLAAAIFFRGWSQFALNDVKGSDIRSEEQRAFGDPEGTLLSRGLQL